MNKKSEEIEMNEDVGMGRTQSMGDRVDRLVGDVQQRKLGTIVPAKKKVGRKVVYDIEIYKAYGGDVLEDDSGDENAPKYDFGDEVQQTHDEAAVPFDPSARKESESKQTVVMARVTMAGVNSWWKTYFFLVKGFLGSGMLTLPLGFSNAGGVMSIVCMAVICMISILGMTTLLEVRNLQGGSFSDVAERATGSTGRLIIDISLAFCQVSNLVIKQCLDWPLHRLHHFHHSKLFCHYCCLGSVCISTNGR